MHVYGRLSTPVALGVLLLFCLYLAIYHGMFGMLVVGVGRRGGIRRALWASPFLWVAVELARYHVTSFPWDLLGTAVVDNVAVSRVATVTGVYGVSFLIMIANAWLAFAILESSGKMAAGALALIALMQAGTYYQPTAAMAPNQARLVQVNLPIDMTGGWTPEQFDNTVSTLVEMSRGQAGTQQKAANPELIIWPESPGPFYMTDQKFRTWISTLANDRKAFLIVGTLGIQPAPSDGKEQYDVFNSASLIAPSGAFVARYDKIHLVPFGEYVPFQRMLFFAASLTREVSTFARGTERKVFDLNGKKAGVFICYESVFPDEVRQFAANGAEVFVNISNDEWFGDIGAPGQHLNMARMRAIENGRWLLRATNSGITAAVDPYGRVVARAEQDVRTTLDAPFDYVSGTTFYTRYGDWFPLLCAIISLAALAGRGRRRGEY